MLDWYVIPRDKVKNITYVYANERAGLISHVQFVWIKSLRHINYAAAQMTGIFSRQRSAIGGHYWTTGN